MTSITFELGVLGNITREVIGVQRINTYMNSTIYRSRNKGVYVFFYSKNTDLSTIDVKSISDLTIKQAVYIGCVTSGSESGTFYSRRRRFLDVLENGQRPGYYHAAAQKFYEQGRKTEDFYMARIISNDDNSLIEQALLKMYRERHGDAPEGMTRY